MCRFQVGVVRMHGRMPNHQERPLQYEDPETFADLIAINGKLQPYHTIWFGAIIDTSR